MFYAVVVISVLWLGALFTCPDFLRAVERHGMNYIGLAKVVLGVSVFLYFTELLSPALFTA